MQAPDGTRNQILRAAFDTLEDKGFAAATSRAVAERGGFNQALVFYYFGSMDALLLAALDWTNERRREPVRPTRPRGRQPARRANGAVGAAGGGWVAGRSRAWSAARTRARSAAFGAR